MTIASAAKPGTMGKILRLPERASPQAGVQVDKSDGELLARTRVGLLVVALLVLGIGGWAATAKIAGAVIASGLIVVDSNIKKVQHPSGGIVGEIRVKNGDLVELGQVVVRLDETQTRAALGIIVSQLIELKGRKARLVAERDDTSVIAFPDGFELLGSDAIRVADGERRLLIARRLSTAGQKSQHGERIKQFELEAKGLAAQHKAKVTELSLIGEELERLTELYKKNLVPVTRVLSMRRDEVRIDGERGAMLAHIGRIGGQIAEINMQILNIEQAVRTDAQKELREIEGRIAELEERRITAEDQLRRVDVLAPQAGVIHELNVHTVGGVIGAGETLMQVVPVGETLAVEVRLAPQDIDQATIGQKVMLRFSAFNQRTTPELPGTIVRLAADLSRETQSNNTYYVARISIAEAYLARLGNLKLVPGMPVEAYIQTGERTAISYLVKPFTDHLQRVFREE